MEGPMVRPRPVSQADLALDRHFERLVALVESVEARLRSDTKTRSLGRLTELELILDQP